MLVDVKRLRSAGLKIHKSVLETQNPVRGDLRYTGFMISGSVGGWEPGVRYDAVLKRDAQVVGGSSLIPDLHNAWVRKIEGDNLMIVGVELVGGFTTADAVPQAWWCKVIPT